MRRAASGIIALLSSGACDRAREPALPAHHWVAVHDDARYHVSLDTAHVRRDGGGVYLVWFETRHAAIARDGGHPFDREVIRDFIRCDPLAFKNVGAMLSLGDGPVVVWQGGDVRRASATQWKPTTPGSVDESAFSEACRLLGEIARR